MRALNMVSLAITSGYMLHHLCKKEFNDSINKSIFKAGILYGRD